MNKYLYFRIPLLPLLISCLPLTLDGSLGAELHNSPNKNSETYWSESDTIKFGTITEFNAQAKNDSLLIADFQKKNFSENLSLVPECINQLIYNYLRPSHLIIIDKLDKTIKKFNLGNLHPRIINNTKTLTYSLRKGTNVSQLGKLPRIKTVYVRVNSLDLNLIPNWENPEIIHIILSDLRDIIEDVHLRIREKKNMLRPLMINNGNSTDVREDVTRDSVLHMLVQSNYDMTNFAIRLGADVNAVNKDGQTALHLACKLGFVRPGIIITLIENETDINIKDKDGQTFFDIASLGKNESTFDILLNYYKKNNPKLLKDLLNDETKGKALLRHWVSKRKLNTVLILSNHYEKNNPEILKELINSKIFKEEFLLQWVHAQGNTITENEIAMNAVAISKISMTMEEYLKERYKKDFDILIKNGANIYAKNKKGQTILELASRGNNEHIFNILLDYYEKNKPKLLKELIND